MLYRPYGSTGIDVSILGFGGMRFENQDDPEACAELMHTAYDAGINYFDTAPGYGKSEELFGLALKEMKVTRAKRPYYIASKTMKSKPDDIRADLETSLKRMDIDSIDFYHVWCIHNLKQYEARKADGVLSTFVKLKEEGLVKHICVSSHMDGEDTGVMLRDFPFAGVLLGYSAMNFPFREAGVAAAANQKQGVVVMNPLGGGIIPRNPEIFSFVKTQPDETVVEAALRFLFNDPRITVSLVGLANQKELREAVGAVEGFQPIPAAKVAAMHGELDAAFNEMCTGCQYCDVCPEEIPVAMLMDAYNQYMLFDDPTRMIKRMKWHWAIPPDDDRLSYCTECGTCLDACTQSLPIIERMEFIRTEAEKFLAEHGSN